MEALTLQSLIEAVLLWDKDLSIGLRGMLASPLCAPLLSLATRPRTWILRLSGILVYSLKKDKRRGILLALSAVILVLLVDGLATYLKSFFLRPRPYVYRSGTSRPTSSFIIFPFNPDSAVSI
jgi:hypothetical protein